MDAGKREGGTGQQQRNPEASAVGIGTILRKAWQIDLQLHLQDRFTAKDHVCANIPLAPDGIIVKHL
jgi:hypothetical protein